MLSDSQKKVLIALQEQGKTPGKEFNAKTLLALESKGLVKKAVTKKVPEGIYYLTREGKKEAHVVQKEAEQAPAEE